MFRTISLCVIVTLCACASWATYTPQYETYNTYSSDINNNIYQTVVVDGTVTGDCYYNCNCGQYGCQQCTIPNCPATHTPQIYNVLNGVGGWSYGQQYSMFSYISYQTTVSIAATPGQIYPSSTEGAIYCGVAAGFIFDISAVHSIRLGFSTTYYSYQSYDGVQCHYNVIPYCSARCKYPSVTVVTNDPANCLPYYKFVEGWIQWGSGPADYSCTHFGPAYGVLTPGACTDQ